jgi:arylsulfatase A-like enzyme
MKKRLFTDTSIITTILGGSIFVFNSSCAERKDKTPFNIVVFFIDDMGWTDLGCYGSDVYETPAIDRLAKSGIRFTDAYSACTVSSPSRAAIMTGKYPAQLHLTDWIEGHKRPDAKLKVPDWTMYLDTAETTIAEELQKAGYTTAIMGKWHLGEDSLYWPENQGFDLNIGGYNRGQPGSYFYPYDGSRQGWGVPPNLAEGAENEYLTYRLTEEAVQFIRNNKDNRFFLYFSLYAVHTPLQAPDTLVEYYKGKIKEGNRHDNPVYAAMVHTVDKSVGRVLKTLEEEGLIDNTAILFSSDNGGLVLRNVTDNSPLRAGKGSAYEGGVRVPLIAKIPGVTPKGKIYNEAGAANSGSLIQDDSGEGLVCREPVVTMDLFPTIMALAGLKAKENDGKNLLPLLKNPDASLGRESIFWHYPHYHPGGATPYSAIRQGNWKLIYFFESDSAELYNLNENVSESENLASQMPEKVSELKNELKTWWGNVNAQMPVKNSNAN